MRKVVLVVARSRDWFWNRINVDMEYKTYSKFRNENVAILDGIEYRYIRSPKYMRGYHNVKVEFWPHSWERKDYDECREIARMIEIEQDSEKE